MVKKLFALASVTALSGLVAAVAGTGCSDSTESGVTGETVDSGEAKEAGSTKDATAKDVEPDPIDDAGACPPPDAIDATKFAYKSPTAPQTACTQEEAEAFITFAGKNTSSTSGWKASIKNATCQACIFGKDSDATWAPLRENAMGQIVGVGVGACMAIASGIDDCGRKTQQEYDCVLAACSECSTSQATFNSCAQTALKTVCKTASEAIVQACGDKHDAARLACKNKSYVFEAPILAQCVGGIGADAGDGG